MFGYRLRATKQSPYHLGRAFIFHLGALLVTAGLVTFFVLSGMTKLPGTDESFEPSGIEYMIGSFVLGMFVAAGGWGRAWLTNLTYAVAARVPVILVTLVSAFAGLETHYVKRPANLPEVTVLEALPGQLLAQAALWIPITVMLGGMFSCIGGALAARRR